MVAFWAFGFCTRHHERVKNNGNKICSKWSVIKWEICIRKKNKLFPLCEKKGKNLYKRAPKAMGLGFCTRHQVKNNENEIWSKWSLIKWEIFIRLFFFNYSILGKKGKIPQKTSPEGDSCFWGVPYWQ